MVNKIKKSAMVGTCVSILAILASLITAFFYPSMLDSIFNIVAAAVIAGCACMVVYGFTSDVKKIGCESE